MLNPLTLNYILLITPTLRPMYDLTDLGKFRNIATIEIQLKEAQLYLI